MILMLEAPEQLQQVEKLSSLLLGRCGTSSKSNMNMFPMNARMTNNPL